MSGVHQPPENDSEITKDPLDLNGLENELDPGYTQLRAPLEFNVSFAGLMPLIDEVYAQLCGVSYHIAQNLPLSAFSYYIIMHLWGRITTLRKHHKSMTYDEREFFGFVSYVVYLLPEPIAQYLNGIGDIIDSTGVEYLVNLAVQPTADKHGPSGGWAGRITDRTHNVYESIAMPGVAVARIYADLAAGLNPDLAGHWQLPDTIRPVDEKGFVGGNPTANLLGYGPAVALSKKHVKFLQECIKPAYAKFVGPFALSTNLFYRVYRLLRFQLTEQSFKVVNVASVYASRFGSQMLVCFTVRATEDPNIAPPTSYYADNTISARCSVKQDDRFGTLAKVFTYRIKKDTFPAGVNQWCCFDFNNYREVPRTWVKNRNELFDNVVLWNSARFGTSFTSANRLRVRYVRAASSVQKS